MKIVNLFKGILFVFLFLPFNSIYSKTIYVATDGDGTDGSSWVKAYTNIQTAIDAALSDDTIWVKEGVYYSDPTAPGAAEDVNRALSITLKSGVKLYGGFTADEVTVDDRPMSDLDGDGVIEAWEFSSPSVISGEIQNDGDNTNNTQHLVIVPDGVDANTLLDGFTIENGYSDAQSTVSGIGTFVFASGVNISGGSIVGCIIENCESSSSNDSYGGGICAINTSVNGCYVDGCAVTGDEVYGGGVYLKTSEMKGTLINNCSLVSTEMTGVVAGGGVYSTSAIVDSCIISGCSSDPGSSIKSYGGGMYNGDSHVIYTKIFDNKIEGSDGKGGGVYAVSSTYMNSMIFNNEASINGAGAYSTSSYFTNCVIVNNKNTGSGAIGGGVYGGSATSVYNTVIWGNSSAVSSQVNSALDINNCAVEDEQLGVNGIALSSSNSGSDEGVLYPEFTNPTSFKGNTNGNATYESELVLADWNISLYSDLIEKGDNNGFYEASVGYDLDGDGVKTKQIDDFTDFANEKRLFNYKVDIGAFESVFVELTLPDPITMEYGLSLAEVIIEGGSATDLRDGSVLVGEYTFADGATVPQFADGEPVEYDIVFTPEDNITYAQFYEMLPVTITAKELTMSGLSADDKVYDGTTDVTFSGSATLEGVVGTDDVTLNATGISAEFEDKNTGVDKNVVFSGYTLSGVDKGNYYLSLSGALATITPKPVSVSLLTANDRDYDGTVDATYSGEPDVSGAIAGDDVAVDESSAAALFDTKTVGVDKTVTFSGFSLTGSDAGNYSLSQPADSKATISPLAVIVEGVSVADKVYDATTNATIEGTAYVNGVIPEDDVTLNSTSASAGFDSKNVGTDKLVSYSGYFIMGADAVNYSLSQPNSGVADITVKELTVSGLSVQSKQYDGTVDASLNGTATLNGEIAGDDVSLNTASISGAFSDTNVGTGIEVSISGISLSGVDQSNYSLTIPGLSADITAVAIEIVADDKSKNYSDADPELTYVVTSGTLVGSDDFTGVLVRETGEDSGTYAINQGTLSLSSNYNISFTPGVFTINKNANAIEFSLDPVIYYLNETDQISLDATSTSGLTISYSSSDPEIVSVSGNTLTVNSFGTATITASDAGGTNYIAADDVNVDVTIAVKVIQKGTNMLLVNNSKNVFTSYQWYDNNGAITGATKQYYYNSEGLTGTYYCELNGKGNSDEWNSGSTTTATTSVYPSPVLKGSTFNVEFTNVEENTLKNSTMSIYSLSGKLIKQISDVSLFNQVQIEEPGIYIIKTEGEVQSVKKIIVK